METIKIQTSFYITEEQVKDVLCTALEGGSNYWYDLDIDVPLNMTYDEHIVEQVMKGESIPVYDIEDDEDEEREPLGYISLANIKRGFKLYAEHNDIEALLDGGDANDADTWFQLAVLGEIVYG